MTEINPAPPPIQKRNQNHAPLSASQEGLWVLHQLTPDSATYNVIYLFKLKGGVNYQFLESSLNELIHRHEILRTVYSTDDEEKPIQVVRPFEAFLLPTLDYSSLKPDEKGQTLRTYAIEQGSKPFDLRSGPVCRFTLLNVGPEEDYLFFAIHHIAFDDWSRHIFIQDLIQLYEAYQSGREPKLTALPIQYTDYAFWQKEWIIGETRTKFVNHWRKILSGELPILALSTDHPRPANQEPRGFRHDFELSPSFSERIKEFCRNERLTPSIVLIAGYAILLTRYTGQEDIIIGCPFANRPRSEQDGSIGYFVNILPIRLNLGSNLSVRELLKQVRNVIVDTSTWQALPFEMLVSELDPKRELGHTPFIQAIINILNVPRRQSSIPGLEIDLFLREQTLADFDISLELSNANDHFNANLVYNMDLFDESAIFRMVSHYQNILLEILSQPESSLSRLQILSSSEKQQILLDWNNTDVAYPDYSGLHEMVEEQARKQPDALAVVFEGQQLTYKQLDSLSNRLARRLQQNGIGPEELVAINMDRSIEVIIAILGIFKAGGAYVPLDPYLPLDRKKLILEETRAKIILVNQAHEKTLPDIHAEVIDMNGGWENSSPRNESKPANIATADSLAYIIFTSGSTGMPKGVLITQRGLVNLAEAQRDVFDTHPGDRVLQFSSLNFDASIFEIAMALGAGAAIVLAPQEAILPGPDLQFFLIKNAITHLTIPPSVLACLPDDNLSCLKTLAMAGEICPPNLVERWKKVPNLFNLYGPTEATVWASTARITLDGGKPSIGFPIPNVKIYILDRYLNLVPEGVVGELVIGGIGLARGYLNMDIITTEHFVPSPFPGQSGMRLYRSGDLARWLPDGSIDILGRVDNQVKIRGYRIELGEIETVLLQHPFVSQVAVVARAEMAGSMQLVGYVTGKNEEWKNKDETILKIRNYLKDKLPDYMVPGIIVLLDAFPMTVGGKIDRKALPEPETDRQADKTYIAPRNQTEQTLSEIWMDVLGISSVSMDDDFFDVGGNSLSAIRLITLIQDKFEITLPVRRIFEFQSILDLAPQVDLARFHQNQDSYLENRK
jgi:amino acid adenylation domain-containing protein